MTPDTPANPSQGTPVPEGAINDEAEQAKAAASQEQAAEAAEGSAPEVPTETSEEPVNTEQAEELATADAPSQSPDDAPKRRVRRRARAGGGEVPTPAPTRTRREVPAGLVVRAQAKYVRSSARKARLVCDTIRGKSVTDARAILALTPRAVARDWSKVLESAVANAENNHDLDGDDLRIKSIKADEGPTLKRFRPRAMGRATPIRKRTSHLSIELSGKEPR